MAHMKSSDISAKHIKDINVKRLKALSEKEIKDKVSDYYTKYFAVYHLQSLAQSNPGIIDQETILTIQDLLKDPQYSGQRQGLFIFRQAAETLGAIIIHSDEKYLAEMALSSLKNVLKTTTGYAHRACAETLGAFPLNISGPNIKDADIKHIPLVSWQEISGNNSQILCDLYLSEGVSLCRLIVETDCLYLNLPGLTTLHKTCSWNPSGWNISIMLIILSHRSLISPGL